MPTIAALFFALMTSLIVERAVQPYVSVRIKAAIALLVFFGVEFVARRWLVRLRDGGRRCDWTGTREGASE